MKIYREKKLHNDAITKVVLSTTPDSKAMSSLSCSASLSSAAFAS
jgi:hypothetical protein